MRRGRRQDEVRRKACGAEGQRRDAGARDAVGASGGANESGFDREVPVDWDGDVEQDEAAVAVGERKLSGAGDERETYGFVVAVYDAANYRSRGTELGYEID